MTEKELMTTDEVAELTRKSRRTLEDGRNPKRFNGLPFVRIGRHIRYRRADVREYIEAGVQRGEKS